MIKLDPSLKNKLTKRGCGESIYKEAIKMYKSPNYRFKDK